MYIPNIDKKIEHFNLLMLKLFDLHAPLRQSSKRRSHHYAPWITDNIKFMQKLRNNALKKFKLTKLSKDYEAYKQLRNFTTAATRTEKKVYLRSCGSCSKIS